MANMQLQLVKQNMFQINWNTFGFCIHYEIIIYLILELESKKESAQIKIKTK